MLDSIVCNGRFIFRVAFGLVTLGLTAIPDFVLTNVNNHSLSSICLGFHPPLLRLLALGLFRAHHLVPLLSELLICLFVNAEVFCKVSHREGEPRLEMLALV